MMDYTLITILGIVIIFLGTTLGSAMVYAIKGDISSKANTILLGFASGVMIAASVWSLLIPSLDMTADSDGVMQYLPTILGFVLGGIFLVILDKVVPHFHLSSGENEGLGKGLGKTARLFLAVTLHNIPEGLAVGFTFGAASLIGTDVAYLSALALSIGMCVQNFPEGAALALPLKRETGSRHKAFLLGTLSGAVEPISAVIGLLLSQALVSIQPWLLAFSAGAMVFVVAEDLIPEAMSDNKHSHLGTWGLMIGFVLMMILDVALG